MIWGLKLPQVRKYILFILTNIAYNALIQSLYITRKSFKKKTFRTVLRQCFVEISRFAICRKIIKFVGLLFADWLTEELCGFLNAERGQEFADLRFACLPLLSSKESKESGRIANGKIPC
jgi:hypothetical protein